MIPITIDTVLEYYDGVQLFIGSDRFGASYICVLVFDAELGYERYLGVRVSEERINELKHNTKSLRFAFTHPEDGDYYFLDCVDGNTILAERARPDFMPSDEMLPDEAYRCHFPSNDDLIVSEQKRMKAPVFTIGVDDVVGTHRAPTDVASILLGASESLFNAVTRNRQNKLYLVGASAASLNLHISVGRDINMFGQVPAETEAALQRIKELLENNVPVDKMLTKEYNAVKKIYSALCDEGLALKYNFKVSDDDNRDNSVYIPAEKLKEYYNELEGTEEIIRVEPVKLRGSFVSCNIKTGRWEIALDDGKSVKGCQKDNKSILEGVVISDITYDLNCKRETRRTKLGNDDIDYYIESFEALQR